MATTPISLSECVAKLNLEFGTLYILDENNLNENFPSVVVK